MKVTINATKEEIEHLKACLSYMDSCGVVQDIIHRVIKKGGQNENHRKTNKKIRRKSNT